MSYDAWKTRSPDDEPDYWCGHAPEVWEDCPDCGGEGSFEKYEPVSKWSIDPPCGYVVPCEKCGGIGGWIVEAS